MTRTAVTLLLLLAFAGSSASAQGAAPRAADSTPLAAGETFTIVSEVLGETRRINVYTPPRWGDAADAPLPVLYMPDGGIGEDFLHVAGLVQVSVGNGTMRPFLLVGIENTERRRDLTGPTESAEDRRIAPRVGGSAAFRAFIRTELMPAIRARYRTTDETAIVGESLAGLFVVESFLEEPELFDTWIAFDPSLWWDDARLVRSVGERLRSRVAVQGTLYLASSGEPTIAPLVRQLADSLRARAHPELRWHHVPMPEETHGTIYHPAALRAFRALFAPGTRTRRVTALTNGHWLQDGGFVSATRYVVDDTLRDAAPSPPDTTIDLGGGYVVPPFGEAHNHNVEASSRVDATIARYLRDGVFYVANPGIVPRGRVGLAGKVNVPTGVDVAFSTGGLTGPGGHPIGVVARNLGRGIWTAADGEGAFLFQVASRDHIARKWPALRALRPDFVKVYLLYSEEFGRRLADTASVGWRGLDPALLPEIVARAHADSLRVVAHVETAADFRAALAAGVDQIGHIPGFRGDERVQLPDPAPYTLTDADARDAARRGTVIVTTLGGAAELDPAGPDSAARRALDALNRRNLATLHRAGARLAIGSDSYGDDSKAEVEYLRGLGVHTDAELLALWSGATPRAIFPGRAIGGLADGHEASFLVLGCDPLARFACTGSIKMRMKDGRLLAVPPG